MAARWPLALAALLVLVTAVPAQAQLRFGANLNRPANVAYGCETLPTTDFLGNRFFLPSGFGTCTYMGAGSATNLAESPQAPAEGVLVKTGPQVGPMRAVILRSTRSTTVGLACCFFAAESQVFVPQPNAITAVPVRLPMRKDFQANFGETIDYLGISVLAQGVPIPGHDEGVPGDPTRNSSLAWWPHVQPGDTRADGAGIGSRATWFRCATRHRSAAPRGSLSRFRASRASRSWTRWRSQTEPGSSPQSSATSRRRAMATSASRAGGCASPQRPAG